MNANLLHWLIVVVIVLILFARRFPHVRWGIEQSTRDLRRYDPALWQHFVSQAIAKQEREQQLIRSLRGRLLARLVLVILAVALSISALALVLTRLVVP